jgi:nucleoside-diphosphate-sugar epimerase
MAYHRNYGLDVRIARFHNVFGPMGTWTGGKEKAPAAVCRKVAEVADKGEIEIWGDGKQTRSFLYIDECIEGVIRFMESDFIGPVNIGSEEMVTINRLVEITSSIANKIVYINNIEGDDFIAKYGFKCPIGVRGRRSDNRLYRDKMGWEVSSPLEDGIRSTYHWIDNQLKNKE